MAIGQPARTRARRPFGVRLYLAIAFAAVALITAGISYLLIAGSSDDAASQRAVEITVGRTVRLADRLGGQPHTNTLTVLEKIDDPGYATFAYDSAAHLVTSELSRGVDVDDIEGRRREIRLALTEGRRTVRSLPGGITKVTEP